MVGGYNGARGDYTNYNFFNTYDSTTGVVALINNRRMMNTGAAQTEMIFSLKVAGYNESRGPNPMVVPFPLLESINIYPEETSAQYGSGAISAVVNNDIKREYVGLSIGSYLHRPENYSAKVKSMYVRQGINIFDGAGNINFFYSLAQQEKIRYADDMSF